MIKAKVKYAIQVCYNHNMREIELEIYDDDQSKVVTIAVIRLDKLAASELAQEIRYYLD